MRFSFASMRWYPLMVMCLGFGAMLALGGCGAHPDVQTSPLTISTQSATATRAPTATATPHPVTTFTCAPGSLPVAQMYTRASCDTSTEQGFQILRASYTAVPGAGITLDDSRMTSAGWLVIQQEHGDSPNGAIGTALYFGMSAWFTVQYDIPVGTLSVEQSIPANPQASVPCGAALAFGGEPRKGVPLPTGSLTADSGLYTVAPVCLQDVAQFYPTALHTAGWTQMQPFQTPLGGSGSATVTVLVGTYSSSGSTVDIWLSGAPGTPTAIIIGPHY